MKRLFFGLSACSLALTLSACATQSRFEWGSYDQDLYSYSKSPDRQPALETALVKAIADGRKSNRVAPGLQAELGYIYLMSGKRTEADELFEAEMRDFPESIPFLKKIMAESAQ